MKPCLILIQNSGKELFKRNGGKGDPMQEIVLVDEKGNIDSSTPITWKYDKITYARAYYTDDNPITVSGGIFTTRANGVSADHFYFKRGILVNRSNVTIAKLQHKITDEGYDGAPYNGFIVTEYCNNVNIVDTTLQGHKTYYKPDSTPMGTYDILATFANNINYTHVTQFNSIGDTNYWGIMGSNYCRNLTYDRCYLSRFDAHKGVYNATIRNSTLGHGHIQVVGFGTLTVDNVTVYGNELVTLRHDFGSFWNGKIVLKNIDFQNNKNAYIVSGEWQNLDYGYIRRLPEVVAEGIKLKTYAPLYVYSNFGLKGYLINEAYFPKNVTVSKTQNAQSIAVSENATLNSKIVLIQNK